MSRQQQWEPAGDNLNISWLGDFLSVVDAGSFSRAADAQHRTASTLGRRIASLETWAGAPLFERGSQALQLTSAGERLLPLARSVLQDLRRYRRWASQHEKALHRPLAICGPSVAIQMAEDLLDKFLEREPNVMVTMLEDRYDACLEMFQAGDSDFMACFHYPPLPPEIAAGSWVRTRHGRELLIPVCAPAADGKPTWDLDDSATGDVPYYGYHPSSYLARVVDSIASTQNGRLSVRAQGAGAYGLARYAMDGKGVAWLPASIVRSELREGTLVRAGGTLWEAAMYLEIYHQHPIGDDGARVAAEFQRLAC